MEHAVPGERANTRLESETAVETLGLATANAGNGSSVASYVSSRARLLLA